MTNLQEVFTNDSNPSSASGTDPKNWIVGLRLFRGPLLIILYLSLLAINISVWIKYNINFVEIFKLKTGEGKKYLKKILAIVIILLMTLVIFMLLFFLHPSFVSESIPRYSIPLFPLGFVIVVCFPLCCLLDPDFWVFRVFLKTLLAPVFSVDFPQIFLADQLNSLVEVFLSLEFTICFYTSPDCLAEDWDSVLGTGGCSSGPILLLIKCLPDWWRLAQCLR